MSFNKRQHAEQDEKKGYDIRNERILAAILTDEIEVGTKKVKREVVVAQYGEFVPRLVTFHKWKDEDGADKYRVFSAKPQLVDGIIAAGPDAFTKLADAVKVYNAAAGTKGGGKVDVKAAKAAAQNKLMEMLTAGSLTPVEFAAALSKL